MRGSVHLKRWTKSIVIDAPIEDVWQYLDGDLEKMQQIMPKVVSNTPVTETKEVVGSVYRQEYLEGNRVEAYDVHVTEYENTPTHKHMKVAFTLAQLFDITAKYEVEALPDSKTKFVYTTTNNPLKWFIKLFLLFGNDKVMVEFVERVKQVAESNRA